MVTAWPPTPAQKLLIRERMVIVLLTFTAPLRRGLVWLIKIEHIHWTQC